MTLNVPNSTIWRLARKEKQMRVDYDRSTREFKIYKSDYDTVAVCMPHSPDFESYDVVSESEFEVVGRFGERARYNADGRWVS